MKLHNDRQNLRSARQRGTPLPPLPSRRSRPLVDRTDGDDERGVPRLFELEAEGIDQPKPTDRRRTRPEKYSCLVAAEGRAKISAPSVVQSFEWAALNEANSPHRNGGLDAAFGQLPFASPPQPTLD